MCVTLTSCNKEDEVTEISGNYLLLDVYDKEGKGTYINDNKLPLCMTFYINEIPV